MWILRLSVVLVCALAFAQDGDAVASAMAALQRADYASAEQVLRAQLKRTPQDAEALSVLAVVLDQEKKYDEADDVYQRALAHSSNDPALLNNFGNHLIATGKMAAAKRVFFQVISIEADNANALVQLAGIDLKQKLPAEALHYLDRIPQGQRNRPDVVILRMQADYALGHKQEADAILARVGSTAAADPRQSFGLGVALAAVGQFEKAETYFSKTLEAEPGNFDALYDLGLAASHAGHNDRAQTLLQQAAAQRPDNVDVLYDLAVVQTALGKKEDALALLAKASVLAPKRTDVLELEARTSAALGFFADAGKAWDQYIQLDPKDEVARRERAFAQTAMGDNMAAGLAELNAFARKHPMDAVGHYELGTAETARQPEEALVELNRALVLKTDLTSAHVARGLLLYRQGKPETALKDFEFAAQRELNNGAIQDRLGETYMALDRTSEALPVLRRAAQLLPSDSTVLLHLGRALAKSGQQDEASAVFARCRELGPNRLDSPHAAGLVEFLELPPDEQWARYRAGVERTVQNHPDNAEAEVRYLDILLEDKRTGDAAAVVQRLSHLKLTVPLRAEAAHLLLAASQYSSAMQLVGENKDVNSPELKLDATIAEAHLTGPKILDKAEPALQQALQTSPARPELYREAALLSLRHNDLPQALRVLEEGVHRLPDNPELALMRALVLEVSGSRASADRELQSLESRWPDWDKVWIAHALVYSARQQPPEAERMRQRARALGGSAALANLSSPGVSTDTDLVRTLPVLFP